LELGIDARVKN